MLDLKLDQWFLKRRWKCENFTTTSTTTTMDNGQVLIRKAHLSLRLGWATKSETIFFVCLFFVPLENLSLPKLWRNYIKQYPLPEYSGLGSRKIQILLNRMIYSVTKKVDQIFVFEASLSNCKSYRNCILLLVISSEISISIPLRLDKLIHMSDTMNVYNVKYEWVNIHV